MESLRQAARETGAPAGEDDEALARAVAAGDVQAWERFFTRYAPWAYRFAHAHLGGHRADAEDLCSEIMMTAARAIRHFNPRRGSLDRWLLGLARHRLARFCRQRGRAVPLVPDGEQANPGPGPVAALPDDASLLRESVNRALASLPARQAEALVGKYVWGYSVEELARRAGVSEKAVESLLSRGRAGFRAAFQRLLGSSSGGGGHD